MEKYKTNPLNSGSGGGIVGTAHKGTGQKHALLDIINGELGLTTPQEPNTCLVPMSHLGTNSQDATIPQGPSAEDILDCF